MHEPVLSPAASGEQPPSEAAIAGLIERATTSTSPSVDPLLLRAIKSSARSSDAAIRLAFRSLLTLMKKPHSHVRLLSLLIADELFMRSKLFRSLLAAHLDAFLPLVVGFRRSHPLPPPASSAATLRKTAIQMLERWHHRFGAHYRQLRLAVDYLKDSVRVQFPGLPAAAAARTAREARTQEILASKVEQLSENFTSIKNEVRGTMDEIRSCLEIVRVEDERFDGFADEEEEEEIASLAMRSIRMESLKAGERVHETRENKVVLDALREAHRLLVSKHLIAVQEWISVLVRVDLGDNCFRDAALKEFIDIKNEIKAVEDRCCELGLVLDDGCREKAAMEEEDDDFWEEGKIEVNNPTPGRVESNQNFASTSKSASKGKSVMAAASSRDDGEMSNGCNGSRKVDPERASLLAEAPVMTWSSALENWGSGRDAHVNQRGLELENHWGRMDNDAVIPAEKIAELSVHRTVYKEEPVEIRPCLMPLRKGGLCQRKDMRICPFHGPIIPRDAEGNPIVQNGASDGESAKEASSSGATGNSNGSGDSDGIRDLDKETIEQLAKQAVKNVRERDRDEKALERAKRAKIREHNEDVLRQAALASTSHSAAFGQPPEAPTRSKRRGKAKEPTLASMLKKKVTTKDRIAQRLLNTRVRDATIRELSQGEDLSYREAFPNQW